MNPTETHRTLNNLRYRCHRLRAKLWNLDNRRERFEAHRWVEGHIGESLKTASHEELVKLEGYLAYKLEHGHCPLHEEENANVRYKREGGSTKARQKIKESLITRDGERCVNCGAAGVPLTLDHIRPIALGGKNKLANSQLLCIPCHTRKTRGDSRRAYQKFFAATFPEKLAARRTTPAPQRPGTLRPAPHAGIPRRRRQ